MLCENLAAYVDGESRPLGRLLMRAHLRLCSKCQSDIGAWNELHGAMRAADDAPVPPDLRGRVLREALVAGNEREAATVSHRHLREVLTLKRIVSVTVLLVALIAGVLWRLPRQGDGAALADVEAAMARVKSIHLTGRGLDAKTGQEREFEGWIDGTKYRILDEVEDIIDDGEKRLLIRTDGDRVTAFIDPGGESQEFLALFLRSNVIAEAIEKGKRRLTSQSQIVLPDGRRAEKLVFSVSDSGSSDRVVLIIDAKTDLVEGLETYGADGGLRLSIDWIEYDVVIPDSVFQVEIPGNAVVIDRLSRSAAGQDASWEDLRKAAEELLAAGAVRVLMHPPDSKIGVASERSYHPELRFTPMDRKGLIVLYSPARDVYHVLGKALVEEQDDSRRTVVENGEYTPPGPPLQMPRASDPPTGLTE